jgi:hypothetical protein
MESPWPGTLGVASCAVPQHGVELGFDDGEPVRCKSPWPAGDWWAWRSPDVVNSVVAHLALDARGANEVWNLGEKCVHQRTATDYFHAGGLRTGSLAIGQKQRRNCVQQAVVLTVHQEAEMGLEVGPDEGLCDVGRHESPRELPA